MSRFVVWCAVVLAAWALTLAGIVLQPHDTATWLVLSSTCVLSVVRMPYEWKVMSEKRWRDRRCR